MKTSSDVPAWVFDKKKSYNQLQMINQDYRLWCGIVKNTRIKNNQQYDEQQNIKPVYTVREVHEMKNAIKRALGKLKGMKTKLELLSELGHETSRYYKPITDSIKEANDKLSILEYIPTKDKLSTSKKIEFTGNVTSTWYDAPLEEFLSKYIHTSVSTKYGYEEIRTIKHLISFVNENAEDAEFIGTDAGVIPKNILLEFLNKLLLVERILDKGVRVRTRYDSQKLNKLIYEMHKDFQMPPKRIVHIMIYCFYKEYNECNILQRSAKHFLKNENLPNWALKAYKSFLDKDETQGISMRVQQDG